MRVMTLCPSLMAAGCLQMSAQKVTFQDGTVSLKQAFEKIESVSVRLKKLRTMILNWMLQNRLC